MKNHLLSLKKEKRFFGTILLSGIFILATGLSAIRAENTITTGTTLKVLPGAMLVSAGSMVIKSGAVLDNAGTLILKNNLVNENSTANSLGSGLVELSGTTNQSISGPNIIHNLTVNNTSGVTFSGETKHQFSLWAQPVGIYVIQVRSDDRMQVAKIVKK